MSIWYFKIKRDIYGRLVKNKSCLCTHVVMQQLGVNYFDTYYPVVNWISDMPMPNLSIFREIHTKSVDFVLAYTQADIKSEIFMELLIGFRIEGSHPRSWVVRLKNSMA